MKRPAHFQSAVLRYSCCSCFSLTIVTVHTSLTYYLHLHTFLMNKILYLSTCRRAWWCNYIIPIPRTWISMFWMFWSVLVRISRLWDAEVEFLSHSTYHHLYLMSASSSTAVTFAQNERVLCYHGPLIYEAKVLKVENFTEANTVTGALGPHCFVHYKGWKQTWVVKPIQWVHRADTLLAPGSGFPDWPWLC